MDVTLDHAAAAPAAARSAGLDVDRAEVMRVAANVLVRLDPGPVAARLTGATGRVRGDDFGWGEAALAAHGGTYDEMLLEACVGARVAQGAAYLAATGRGEVGGHLAWLRTS